MMAASDYRLSEREERAWARTQAHADMRRWLRDEAAARDAQRFWFLVRTKRDSGEWSADSVARQLINAGIEAWCPVEKAVKRLPRRQTFVDVFVPIWPKYLLVKTVRAASAHLGVMTFDGVDCLLGKDEEPIALSERIIKEIKAIEADVNNPNRKRPSKFHQGDQVLVRRGPFSDFVGMACGPEDEQNRVDVELDIFNRLTPCRIGVDDLKKLA